MKNLAITILTAAILTTSGVSAGTFPANFGEDTALLIYMPMVEIVTPDGVSSRGSQVPGFGFSR
jgi:hypothetical protein